MSLRLYTAADDGARGWVEGYLTRGEEQSACYYALAVWAYGGWCVGSGYFFHYRVFGLFCEYFCNGAGVCGDGDAHGIKWRGSKGEAVQRKADVEVLGVVLRHACLVVA